jgi:uncharacterized membrane protein
MTAKTHEATFSFHFSLSFTAAFALARAFEMVASIARPGR